MTTKILNKRKSVRVADYDYSQNGMYYITICTKNRNCIFGEIKNGVMFLSDAGKIANVCWNEITKHFSQVSLHEFVIMPDHIHGIIEINNSTDAPVGAKHLSPYNELKNNSKRANNDSNLRTDFNITINSKPGQCHHRPL